MTARSTLTMLAPVPRGASVRIGDEPSLFRVCSCRGSGPYVVTVRRETRWDRIAAWLRFEARRPREWWLNTRCLVDDAWCWRKATADYLCDRHWLAAVENGDGL